MTAASSLRTPSASLPARALLVATAALSAGLGLHAAHLETPTVDEYAHLPAGAAYLVHGRYDLYANNPPLFKELLALPVLASGARVPPAPPRGEVGGWGPWVYGDRFYRANVDDYLSLFASARAVTVLVMLLVGLGLFFYGRRRVGEPAAALAATLWWLSPTVIGHGHLATPDVAAAGSILAAAVALAAWAREGGWLRAGLVGAAVGLALLVKLTAVLLVPAALLVAFLRPWSGRVLAEGALGVGVALLLVHAGYAFTDPVSALGELELRSATLSAVQSALPAGLPVPLPSALILGLDDQRLDTEQGEFGAFFFGEVSPEGFLLYDVVALLVKTPLPVLVFFAFAVWGQRRRPLPPVEVRALGAVLLVLAVALLFANRLDIGVRYLLPLVPLMLALSLPAMAAALAAVPWVGPVIAGGLALSAALAHPGHLGWFNALALGQGPKILADSNLDWGQDLYRVPAIVEDHRGALGEGPLWLLYFGHVDPALYGIEFEPVPARPVSGLVVVSHQFRVGLPYLAPAGGGRMGQVAPGHLAWLEGLEPVARRGSLWVYEVPDSALRGPEEAGLP